MDGNVMNMVITMAFEKHYGYLIGNSLRKTIFRNCVAVLIVHGNYPWCYLSQLIDKYIGNIIARVQYQIKINHS